MLNKKSNIFCCYPFLKRNTIHQQFCFQNLLKVYQTVPCAFVKPEGTFNLGIGCMLSVLSTYTAFLNLTFKRLVFKFSLSCVTYEISVAKLKVGGRHMESGKVVQECSFFKKWSCKSSNLVLCLYVAYILLRCLIASQVLVTMPLSNFNLKSMQYLVLPQSLLKITAL